MDINNLIFIFRTAHLCATFRVRGDGTESSSSSGPRHGRIDNVTHCAGRGRSIRAQLRGAVSFLRLLHLQGQRLHLAGFQHVWKSRNGSQRAAGGRGRQRRQLYGPGRTNTGSGGRQENHPDALSGQRAVPNPPPDAHTVLVHGIAQEHDISVGGIVKSKFLVHLSLYWQSCHVANDN